MSASDARDRRFRGLYARPTDFKELARLDPEFAAVCVLPFYPAFVLIIPAIHFVMRAFF